MICTLYSHNLGFEKIIETLKTFIPKGAVTFSELGENKIIEINTKEDSNVPGSKLKVSYRERIQPNYQINEDEYCALNQNLKGLFGYVSALPTTNEEIKNLFLQKVQTLNSEFSISQENGITEHLDVLIRTLADSFDAILFVQPDSVVSKSDSQHFLDRNLNLIIDQNGHCEIDELKVSIDSKYYVGEQTEISEDQKRRKEESEIILKSNSIKINSHLPFISSEHDTIIRSAKEIAERVTILTVTNSVAFNHMSGPEAITYLVENNLSELLTPREKDFLQNPTDDKKNQETWKCEGIWTLMWALHRIRDLGFPNDMADLNNIPFEHYPIGRGKNPNDFIKAQSHVRTKAEILNANDLYYRMDWACVDARINGNQITEINGGIVYERHYALNWLINYRGAEWDDVSCDT